MGCVSSEILLRFVLKTAQIQLQSKRIKTHIMLLFQEQQQVEDTAAVMALSCWMPGTGSSNRQENLAALYAPASWHTGTHKICLFLPLTMLLGLSDRLGLLPPKYPWSCWFGREVEVNWVLIPWGGQQRCLPLCPHPCHLPCSTSRGRDPPGPPQKPIWKPGRETKQSIPFSSPSSSEHKT